MIRKFAGYVGQYWRDTILSPVFVILEVILEVSIPLLMARLIDRGITPGNMSVIVWTGISLVVLTLLSLTFGLLAGFFAASASAGFAQNLRSRMFDAVQDFSFYNIDKFSTASLVTRLTTDVSNVQMAFQMIIRIAVRAPVMMAFALIMSISVSARLAMVLLAVVPILALGLYLIIKYAHPVFVRVFKTYDKLNTVVQENVRGIRVVKSFVREDHEIGKFTTVSASIFRDFSLAEKILAFNSPLMQFSMYLSLLGISWFGARMIVASTLTTGQLISFISYASQILMSLMMLSFVFVIMIISRASAERAIAVLDEEVDLTEPANPVRTIANGDIEFDAVRFSYARDPDKLCLDAVNLTIRSGQTIGIIGGTGSAKSSLVQLIPRLYDVTGGAVRVGGINVRDYCLQTLRDGVAMVLQKNVLFSGTIRENLRWGNPEATDEELVQACRLAQADEFIRAFPDGYDTRIEQGGSNVSGGQRQRLCIARALLKRPKILILDDSTSAVDTRTDALIRQAFLTEIPETTKLIIAQRVASVMTADQIIVLDNGRVADVGTHDELLARNNIYQEVYYSQRKGGDGNHVA